MNPKRFSVRGQCVLALLILLTGLLSPGRAAAGDAFAHGVQLSQAGQFPEAAAAFQDAVRAQPAAGTLVNLGLAEWQRGHAGAAILAWEQARWIDPADPRAAANLNFARQVAQVEEPELKWYETVSTWSAPHAWGWLAVGALWFGVGLLVVPRVFRWSPAAWRHWLAALAFGIFLFSLTGNAGVWSRTQIGFVLKMNAPLQLTPTRGGEVVATLAAGQPVRQVRKRGDYVFVLTPGGSGWLAQDGFGLVCPP